MPHKMFGSWLRCLLCHNGQCALVLIFMFALGVRRLRFLLCHHSQCAFLLLFIFDRGARRNMTTRFGPEPALGSTRRRSLRWKLRAAICLPFQAAICIPLDTFLKLRCHPVQQCEYRT